MRTHWINNNNGPLEDTLGGTLGGPILSSGGDCCCLIGRCWGVDAQACCRNNAGAFIPLRSN